MFMQEETISIVTDNVPFTAETRTWEVPPSEGATKYKVEISTDKLEQEMGRFLQIVSRLFKRAEIETEKKPGIHLDEIELSVEINGEGKVSLIGSGAKAGAKGAITLKFKRTKLE